VTRGDIGENLDRRGDAAGKPHGVPGPKNEAAVITNITTRAVTLPR
jgi:hypothetical protein